MYQQLTDDQKRKTIEKLYTKQKLSYAEIAEQFDTYANRIRRDAKKFGIPARDKSQAQKNVLKMGKSAHPTEGKERNEEEKHKIGLGVYKNWEECGEEEKQNRRLKSKQRWEALSDTYKQNMLTAAHNAIRQTSAEGSKLEKYLLETLVDNGYKPQFHKEEVLANTRLQIDIYVPEKNVAIEVDGPSHFAPVWGDQSLNRNTKSDQKKTGLILGKGMKLIRIRHEYDFSAARAFLVGERLIDLLQGIDTTKEKLFNIEDNS